MKKIVAHLPGFDSVSENCRSGMQRLAADPGECGSVPEELPGATQRNTRRIKMYVCIEKKIAHATNIITSASGRNSVYREC